MFEKIKIILSKKQLRYFYFFIFLSFISMILETIGVGLIIPFMQVFISDEPNQYIISFFNIVGIYPESKYNLILILISVLAFVYTLKAIFLTYVSYTLTKLLADTRVSLSNRLYKAYLNKPYSFHLNNNSSKLIRNIHEVDLVVYVIKCCVMLVSEIIVFLGISTFVILYEPVGSLIIISFLGSVGYLFYRRVQIKAEKWGVTRQIHAGLSLKYLPKS